MCTSASQEHTLSNCMLIDMCMYKIFLSSKCPWLGLKEGQQSGLVSLTEDPGSDSDSVPSPHMVAHRRP